MALNHDMIVQNVEPVPAASGDMTLAQIDEIARRAQAQALTLNTDASQQGDAANETKVAGELAMEAAGGGVLKLASMALDIVGDRMDAGTTSLTTPIAGKTDGIVTGGAVTMDQMILKSMRGEELVMSANLAEYSLRGQGKSEGIRSQTGNVEGVQLAKRLTFDKVYANQHALDSVPQARAQYASTMHVGMQLSPGLAPSPNLRPSEFVAQAKEDNSEELSRWRDRGEGTWS